MNAIPNNANKRLERWKSEENRSWWESLLSVWQRFRFFGLPRTLTWAGCFKVAFEVAMLTFPFVLSFAPFSAVTLQTAVLLASTIVGLKIALMVTNHQIDHAKNLEQLDTEFNHFSAIIDKIKSDTLKLENKDKIIVLEQILSLLRSRTASLTNVPENFIEISLITHRANSENKFTIIARNSESKKLKKDFDGNDRMLGVHFLESKLSFAHVRDLKFLG